MVYIRKLHRVLDDMAFYSNNMNNNIIMHYKTTLCIIKMINPYRNIYFWSCVQEKYGFQIPQNMILFLESYVIFSENLLLHFEMSSDGSHWSPLQASKRNTQHALKNVLYSMLGPNLVGLTVAVRNIVGQCFSAVYRGLNHRRYSKSNYACQL